MVESIGESLRFMEALGGSVMADIHRVDFFTSHEGLNLPYEQAQTRQVPRRDGWYNLVHPFSVDRRTNTRFGRRPCRIFSRHQQSRRCEDRTEHYPR